MAIPAPKIQRRMNLAEFLALPEDDTLPVKYELEFGELVEVKRPIWEHKELSQELAHAIRAYFRPLGLGRVSSDVLVVLDEAKDLSYAPDVVFVATERLDRIRKGRVYGAPDLVVEVLSEGTEHHDRGVKKRVYHEYEVPWYWSVDMENETIEEYRWTPEGYVLTQVVLPGEVFRPKLFPELTLDLRQLMGLTRTKPKRQNKQRRRWR